MGPEGLYRSGRYTVTSAEVNDVGSIQGPKMRAYAGAAASPKCEHEYLPLSCGISGLDPEIDCPSPRRNNGGLPDHSMPRQGTVTGRLSDDPESVRHLCPKDKNARLPVGASSRKHRRTVVYDLQLGIAYSARSDNLAVAHDPTRSFNS